jgi:hypothetical protein
MDPDEARMPRTERPYRASWLDAVTDLVRRIPIPFGFVYLAIGLVIALGRSILGWVDGSYPAGTFFRVHVLDGLNPLYLFAAIHYLDNMAHRALADFRPILRGGETEYADLRYRLTTMPAVPALILGILGTALGAIYLQVFLSPVDIALSNYFTSPAATVLDTVLSALSGLAMIMFGYHSIHQLSTVSRIYTRHTNVSAFDVGPLYALSRVTAGTSVALLIFSYVYLAFYGDWQINSVSNAVLLGVILLVALATFVVPLFGAHRLMQREKRRRLSDIARRLEIASDALHARTDSGTYTDETDHIGVVIDSLLKERTVVAKTSTWPWDPDALRAVITALLLPLVIWAITRILERVGI